MTLVTIEVRIIGLYLACNKTRDYTDLEQEGFIDD